MLGDSAYPYPSVLRSPLTDFDLRSPIFIGARCPCRFRRFRRFRRFHRFRAVMLRP
jgi:hypothetical protein